MAKAFYLPTDDPGKTIWLNTFSQKISLPGSPGTTVGEDLGLTAGEVSQTADDTAMFAFCIQNQDSFKNEKQERTNYKNLVRDATEGEPMDEYPTSPPVSPPSPVPQGVFKRIPELVRRIKASANYATAIGEDLGIIGDEQEFDPNELKPLLELLVLGSGVLVKWQKGFAEGLRVFVDRGTGYVLLAMDTEPDYLDTVAMPAAATSWKYKAIYEIDGEEVGQFSDEKEVQVQAAV